jgi:hypothetical protein
VLPPDGAIEPLPKSKVTAGRVDSSPPPLALPVVAAPVEPGWLT